MGGGVFGGDSFLFSAAASWVGKKEGLGDTMTGGHTTNEGAAEEGTGLPFTTSSLLQIDASFLSTFFASFFVIVCSELGDKTFLITALLAMKEGNALYVFAGSIGALWLMTALSAAGGVVLPALLSPQVTHAIMIFMLAVFGLKMLYEGLTMEDSDTDEELNRLEHELSLKKEERKEEEEMELKNRKPPPDHVPSSLSSADTNAVVRERKEGHAGAFAKDCEHGHQSRLEQHSEGLHSRHGCSHPHAGESSLRECGEEEESEEEEEEEWEVAALKGRRGKGPSTGGRKEEQQVEEQEDEGEKTSLKQSSRKQNPELSSSSSSSADDKGDTTKKSSFSSALRMPFCKCGHVVSTWLAGVLNPFFLQSFGLTFVAEWGDRSQISTFALAADRSVAGVLVGAALGHGLCTFLAVMGGKVLASRISERMVLIFGGLMFLAFGIVGAVLDV